MVAQGIIRKISVGDLKTGITYVVGQKMRDGFMTITAIRLDIDGSIARGCAKYDILVRESDSVNSRIWKSFEGMSVGIEYDIREEKDVEDKQ